MNSRCAADTTTRPVSDGQFATGLILSIAPGSCQGVTPSALFLLGRYAHNSGMGSARLQISLTAMMLFVACAALNFWLFRLGFLWGLLGLNISKHVIIAYLCQAVGLNRRAKEQAIAAMPRTADATAG